MVWVGKDFEIISLQSPGTGRESSTGSTKGNDLKVPLYFLLFLNVNVLERWGVSARSDGIAAGQG